MATTYQLPAATSVVDFLSSQKQDSSFGARSKLYSTAGIDKRLGAFTGTANQNLALLDHLKAQSAPPAQTSAPATSLMTTAKTTTPQTALPMAVFNPTAPAPIDFSKLSMQTPAAPPLTSVFQAANKQTPNFSQIAMTPPPAAPTAAGALATIAPQATPQTQVASPTGTAGATAGDSSSSSSLTYDTLYPGASQSEGDLVNEFLNSAEGMALLDKRERGEIDDIAANAEAKRLLELKYEGERTTLENNLAEAGLAFSGVRNSQIKALADNLAASELDVDRTLASKLLTSNATLRDGVLKGVEELIKAAEAKDKEAIQQLNAVGLAVVNGQLVPTLASRNADRAAAQQEIANARAQANFEMQERRLQLSEEAADRADARFQQLYGDGKTDGFSYAQELFDLNPGATPAELRAALFQNTELSSTEIDAAMNLLGIPKNIQQNVVTGFIASNFQKEYLSSRSTEFEKAKAEAIKALEATGRSVQVNMGTEKSPKYVTYDITPDQLNTLKQMVETITLEDVLAAKAEIDEAK